MLDNLVFSSLQQLLMQLMIAKGLRSNQMPKAVGMTV
jgi:hypothetical protein